MKPGISSSVVGDATKSKGSWTLEPWTIQEISYQIPMIGIVTEIIKVNKEGSKRIGLINHESDAQRLAECVNGCAGLNPAAYRACVEALREVGKHIAKTNLCVCEDGKPCLYHAPIDKALAQAEGKG